MANDWHYTQNNQPAGTPVSTAELKQMAASGRLQPSDLVWQEGMANWVPASSIKGLFSTSRSAELPVPSPSDSAREPSKPREKEKEREEKKPREKERESSSRKRSEPDEDAKPADTRDLAATSTLLEMHPFLVLLLSVVTAGIFGILYAFAASTSLAKVYNRRGSDASGRPLGRYYHPVRILILSFITLGLYYPFWVSRAMKECQAYTGRSGIGGRLEFCLMLVIPFYSFYLVAFKLVGLVREVQPRAGLKPEEQINPIAVVVTGGMLMPFLGVGNYLMGMACQEALNEAWQTAA